MSQSSLDQSENLSSSEIDAIEVSQEETTEETVFNFEWTGQSFARCKLAQLL